MVDKPFWDVEETIGFVSIRCPMDSVEYKVWNAGTQDQIEQTSHVLSKIRKDVNTLLIYLCKNPQLWMQKPIAYGIIHTLDIHLPSLCKYFDQVVTNNGDINLLNDPNFEIFNYQEMTPNKHGIIGLNKPKVIDTISIVIDGVPTDYEIAGKRSIFLTLRNQRTWELLDYPKIMDLVIHELTHTTCNDVRWKEDNHKPPYQSYHTLMRKWARDCGIM